MKIIVIKIGTNALLNANGGIEKSVLKNISRGIADLRADKWKVVLVSSGSVGAAKNEFDVNLLGNIRKTEIAQIRSSIGQPRLMKNYRDAFIEYSIVIAQALVTRADFASRSRQLSMKNILEKMLRANILPIVNENDFLTPEALDFSDNDQLASFLAGMLKAEKLVLLSDVDGLFTGDPQKKESQKIDVISAFDPKIDGFLSEKKSSGGLGGIRSKMHAAQILSQLGIEMVLANSRTKNILQNLALGTRFPATHHKKKSGLRAWLAAGAYEKGRIRVDQKLEHILHAHPENTISLLGVGISEIEGDFLEGDAIGIFGETEKIARGVAKLSANEMRKKITEKGTIFVHADGLFLL